MAASGRIAVVADSASQGRLLASAVKGQGYSVALQGAPDTLLSQWSADTQIDLWILDLSDEGLWQHTLDYLLEHTDAPILFSDGLGPVPSDKRYPRWERRLLTKILAFIGPPPQQETLADLPVDVDPVAPPPKPPETTTRPPPFLWVLGASLGGPAAVKQFLDALPADVPIAFVVAQHIDPRFLNTLAAVLCRDNPFNCYVAADGQQLQPGDVMIVPVTQRISFDRKGHVFAHSEGWDGPYTPSIDQVMEAALEAYGQSSGAIIFSGMGNDGAIAGPKMAAQGAPVWAQLGEECAASSQPDAVRQTGCVSNSGTVRELAQALQRQLADSRQQLTTGLYT